VFVLGGAPPRGPNDFLAGGSQFYSFTTAGTTEHYVNGHLEPAGLNKGPVACPLKKEKIDKNLTL